MGTICKCGVLVGWISIGNNSRLCISSMLKENIKYKFLKIPSLVNKYGIIPYR